MQTKQGYPRTVTCHDFPEWKMACEREHDFLVNKAKENREEAKKKILQLREEIKKLQLVIKKPLPEKKPVTPKDYIKDVDAKREAVEGMHHTFNYPKDYNAIKKSIEFVKRMGVQ